MRALAEEMALLARRLSSLPRPAQAKAPVP